MTGALAALVLALMLALARHRDRVRQGELEAQISGVFTGDALEVLEYVLQPIKGNAIVSDLSLDAAERRSVRLLRAAVRIARLEAPRVAEGLRVMAALSRRVAVVVDLPPLGVGVWRAWQLRGLAGAGVVLHQVLVAGAERMRLRLWILGQAFRLCVRWLRLGTIRVPTEIEAWDYIRTVALDLGNAATETERTYRRLVESLEAAGVFHARRRDALTRASG